MPCTLVEIYWHLILEPTYSCEMPEYFYQTAWLYILEDSIVNGHYLQNLESQKAEMIWRQMQNQDVED